MFVQCNQLSARRVVDIGTQKNYFTLGSHVVTVSFVKVEHARISQLRSRLANYGKMMGSTLAAKVLCTILQDLAKHAITAITSIHIAANVYLTSINRQGSTTTSLARLPIRFIYQLICLTFIDKAPRLLL